MHKSNIDSISFLFLAILLYGLWAYRSQFLVIGVALVFIILVKLVFAQFRKVWRTHKSFNSEEIDRMNGLEFEYYIGHLLRKQGFTNVSLTEKYDYGVDIVAEKDGIKWGVQVKRYSGLVKADAVRQVVTALKKYNCDRAMVVSNNYFSRVAAELARSNDCLLVDRSKLIAWIS